MSMFRGSVVLFQGVFLELNNGQKADYGILNTLKMQLLLLMNVT